MRIATWNVNGLRARFDYLKIWLEARRPDVVGLQELKLTDDLFPHDELGALGYHAVTHGQKAWNGVAILSRTEARVRHVGLPGQEELGARVLAAEVEGLVFITTYCPNGKNVDHPDYPRKLAWFDALRAHLDAAFDPSEPTVLCGDFNIVPTPLDSWNEERLAGSIFHTDAERERYRQLEAWGLEDLYRTLHPSERAFSWWDYRGGAFHRGHGLRIDLLLGTRPVVDRLEAAAIDREFRKKIDDLTASDHAPVMADLA